MFEIGVEIHVKGEQGRFRILKIRKSGDLDVWGGLGGCESITNTTGHAQFRTFRAADCRPAKVKRKLRKDDSSS